MNISLFKIVLASVLFCLLSLASAHQYKRCGCLQCDHFVESVQRCQCCVYFLHGKRSVDKREYHLLETTENENFPAENRIHSDYRPEILGYSRDKSNVIESLLIPGFSFSNRIPGLPRDSPMPYFSEMDRDKVEVEEVLFRKNEPNADSSAVNKTDTQLPSIVRKMFGLADMIADRKEKTKYF